MHKKGEKRKTRPHHPAAPRGDNKLQLKKNFPSASGGAEAAALPRCGSRQGRGVPAAPLARGGDPSCGPFPTGPFPTWDSLCAAQPDPRGGFCCILAAGGGLRVCVRGEGESGWCWGGDKGVFPRAGGTWGGGAGVGVSAKAPRCRGEAVAQERGFSGLRGEGKRGHSNFIIDFLLRL